MALPARTACFALPQAQIQNIQLGIRASQQFRPAAALHLHRAGITRAAVGCHNRAVSSPILGRSMQLLCTIFCGLAVLTSALTPRVANPGVQPGGQAFHRRTGRQIVLRRSATGRVPHLVFVPQCGLGDRLLVISRALDLSRRLENGKVGDASLRHALPGDNSVCAYPHLLSLDMSWSPFLRSPLPASLTMTLSLSFPPLPSLPSRTRLLPARWHGGTQGTCLAVSQRFVLLREPFDVRRAHPEPIVPRLQHPSSTQTCTGYLKQHLHPHLISCTFCLPRCTSTGTRQTMLPSRGYPSPLTCQRCLLRCSR